MQASERPGSPSLDSAMIEGSIRRAREKRTRKDALVQVRTDFDKALLHHRNLTHLYTEPSSLSDGAQNSVDSTMSGSEGLSGPGACPRSPRSQLSSKSEPNQEVSGRADFANGSISLDTHKLSDGPRRQERSGAAPPHGLPLNTASKDDVSATLLVQSHSESSIQSAHSRKDFLPCSQGTARKQQKDPLIYVITSPNYKQYVGQTCWIQQRMQKHKRDNSKCPKLRDCVQVHGWDSMTVEVLLRCPEEQLDYWECHFINTLDTVKHGLNVLPGGDYNPMKDPVVYARVKAMHEAGEIKPRQLAGYTAEVRAKMSAVHKKRCQTDDGRQAEQGKANLLAGNAHSLKNSESAKAKRAATWEAKRQAKIAKASPEEAAKIIARSKNKGSYQRQCELAGGADKLAAKRKEWARLRKERGKK